VFNFKEVNMKNGKLSLNSNLVSVPKGTFMMGGEEYDDEKPIHKVNVNSFYITPYPITVKEYCDFLNDQNKLEMEELEKWIKVIHPQITMKTSATLGDNILKEATPMVGKENHPVNEVSWYGAKAFCEWAGGDLPTEEQWEYVASWGTGKDHQGAKYPLGNEFDPEKYCFNKNRLENVGNYPPNGLGIYDLGGLVWEWCLDEYDSDGYSKKMNIVNEEEQSDHKIIVIKDDYIIVEIEGEPVIYRR
jgi:formylglycine-generating enzyme required for sulfatase activity